MLYLRNQVHPKAGWPGYKLQLANNKISLATGLFLLQLFFVFIYRVYMHKHCLYTCNLQTSVLRDILSTYSSKHVNVYVRVIITVHEFV